MPLGSRSTVSVRSERSVNGIIERSTPSTRSVFGELDLFLAMKNVPLATTRTTQFEYYQRSQKVFYQIREQSTANNPLST